MSTRERAYNLLNVMTEDDLQMFIDIFGRIYSSDMKDDSSEKKKAFKELEELVESIPPLSEDFDAKSELDEYFKEKYSL